MKKRRRHARFIKRLEVEFSVSDQTNRGISSNFSLGGLFIRTNRPFAPGTAVDLIIHLPDGKDSKAKGLVKMAVKTPLASLKNGMGIELTEKDSNYVNFVQALLSELECDKTESNEAPEAAGTVQAQAPADPEYAVVTCVRCGIRNRVNRSRMSRGIQCGKCGAILEMH